MVSANASGLLGEPCGSYKSKVLTVVYSYADQAMFYVVW